jgi:hypothetical protein
MRMQEELARHLPSALFTGSLREKKPGKKLKERKYFLKITDRTPKTNIPVFGVKSRVYLGLPPNARVASVFGKWRVWRGNSEEA